MKIVNGITIFDLVLDCGHSLVTPGKRTAQFEDGSHMKEFEFNHDVVNRIKKLLDKVGRFNILITGEPDRDVPLKERVSMANKFNADLFVSVHANAYGSGGWNSVRGIETYNYTNSVKGKIISNLLHKELIEATNARNRGVKEANFYVLKYTTMPAVLSESGFMTNKEDAKLLLDSDYRQRIALAHAVAICKYFDVDYMILFEKEKSEPTEKELECLAIIDELEGMLLKLRQKLES